MITNCKHYIMVGSLNEDELYLLDEVNKDKDEEDFTYYGNS